MNRLANWCQELLQNMFYYAVRKGRSPGIYGTWSECESQVKGFKGAQFKKFKTEDEARSFVDSSTITMNQPSVSSAKRSSSTTNDEQQSKRSRIDKVYEDITFSDATVASIQAALAALQQQVAALTPPTVPLTTHTSTADTPTDALPTATPPTAAPPTTVPLPSPELTLRKALMDLWSNPQNVECVRRARTAYPKPDDSFLRSPELDQTVDAFASESGFYVSKTTDGLLKAAQDAILDILGPISAVWQSKVGANGEGSLVTAMTAALTLTSCAFEALSSARRRLVVAQFPRLLQSAFREEQFGVKKSTEVPSLFGGRFTQIVCDGASAIQAAQQLQTSAFWPRSQRGAAMRSSFLPNNRAPFSPSPSRRGGSNDVGVNSRASSDNPRDTARVYTDGACSRNGFSGSRAGIGVYWGDNDSRNVSAPLEGRQTNNRAEIEAARVAIEQAKSQGYKNVVVHTDSKFLKQKVGSVGDHMLTYLKKIAICPDLLECTSYCVEEWMPRWERNNWKLSTGGEVKNREDFQALRESSRGINVRYEHVPGHAGVAGNEAADRLAVQGAAGHKTNR